MHIAPNWNYTSRVGLFYLSCDNLIMNIINGQPALMSLGYSCSLPVKFIHVTAICVLLHWANKRDDDDDDDVMPVLSGALSS